MLLNGEYKHLIFFGYFMNVSIMFGINSNYRCCEIGIGEISREWIIILEKKLKNSIFQSNVET